MGVRKQTSQRRIFMDQPLQSFGFAAVIAGEKIVFRHDADRTTTVGERNQPVPYIPMFRMDRNANLVAVESRRRNAIFNMGKNRPAHGEIRRGFQLQQSRQNAAETARVEDKSGFDGIFVALRVFHGNARLVTVDIDRNHFMPIAYFGALALSLYSQHMVEARALYLISSAPTFRMLIAKIEIRVIFAAHEGGAVLELEAGLDHGPQHPCLFQIFHALRQQTLADGKTRKLFTFKHQHLPPLLTQ